MQMIMPGDKESSMMRKQDSDNMGKYAIQVIGRAMNILDVLSGKPQGLTLDELSNMVGLHRATVYRILTTLELEGFIERTAERPITYMLGLRCFTLGVRMLAGKSIMPRTQEILDAVAESTGESAGLYVRWGKERSCIASSSSSYPPKYRIEVSQTTSLCTGSAGKLLLAYMPYEEAKSILQESLPVIRRYPGTPSEVDVVLKELDTIRTKGFSVSAQELSLDAKSIAIPVWNDKNSVFAALGVTATTERFPDSRIPTLVAELSGASKRLQCLLRGGDIGGTGTE